MATRILSRLCNKVRLQLTYTPVSCLYSKESALSRNASCSRLIREALSDFEDTEFQPLRIRGYALGRNFSRANVDTIQYLEDKSGKVLDIMEAQEVMKTGEGVFTKRVSFKSMFEDGFRSLELNIEGKKCPDPSLQFVTDAFILGFLEEKDFHEDCLRCMHRIPEKRDRPIKNDESYICTLLANHLFSRLTIRFSGHHYFLTNDYHNKFDVCPCMKCGQQIRYRNTGIGSEYLWYGRPDIMLFTMAGGGCNIIYPEDCSADDREFDVDQAENQIIEIDLKSSTLRKKENIEQVVAQTITYSMYQRVRQREKGKTLPQAFLIPTIVASSDYFDIYMYDTQNDILLRNKGDPIPIWNKNKFSAEGETLNLSNILKIWMTLNHFTLKPKLLVDEIKSLKGTCDFLGRIAPKRLHLIEKTISMQKKFLPLKEMELELDVPSVPLKQKSLPSTCSNDEEK
ncbi:uncharacterized protein LOC127730058 [Mytilus californianus]|uniref:uncharacterized protein LOC127730058 n=1 Tax=Mytilus californianus TaxID=6549 RepID=UPI00224710C1|nr:uncharacterized protein LOC127730058 [Mytilus californianus]